MKKKYLLLLTIVLAVLFVFGLLEKLHVIDIVHSKKTVTQADIAGPTEEEKQIEAKASADSKKALLEGSKPADGNTSIPPPQQSPNIELNAKQELNGSVTVYTKLYQIVSGSCALTVKANGKQNQQNASVAYQKEYSSCAGFSVPANLVGTGSWDISVTVLSNGQNYTKNIGFEVK